LKKNRGRATVAAPRPTRQLTLRQALTVEPARHALMQALYAEQYGKGRFGEAAVSCARTVAIRPGSADDQCNLGEILARLDRRSEAAGAFSRAIALSPTFGQAHHKLGLNCQLLGRFEAAKAGYGRASALMPENGEVRALRLAAIIETAPAPDIPALVGRLLAVPARTADEFMIVGSTIGEKGYYREAVRALSRALAINPAAPDCWANRGVSLANLAGYHEAVRGARRALAIRPDYSHAHTNLIFWLAFLPELDVADRQRERRRWAAIQRRAVAPPAPHANSRDPERRLRLGYVSPDFKAHANAGIFGPVIQRHDHSRFELYLYSNVAREDSTTAKFRSWADVWRPTLGLSPDAMAAMIRADRVDVLIDVAGHAAGHQLLTFLRKPAPVQVTAWGSATGTGLSEVDYFLADPVLVPAGVRGAFAETVYDIPGVLPYAAPDNLPDVSPLPAGSGGPVVFGCFNRAIKIGPATLDVWAAILRRVPDARLFLKDRAFDSAEIRQRFGDDLAARGVSRDRLAFAGATSLLAHLDAHARVDIALDPFPVNGGITTCEALLMGLPVVTLLGDDPGSRASASLLSVVGLDDWIAADIDRYVEIAVERSARPAELAELRRTLRQRYLASPIGNPDTYTRLVEAAFRDMWRRWCAGRASAPPAAE
jgi:predicted O-linked N-acetylglucosamine transferase (SPINDLY family)